MWLLLSRGESHIRVLPGKKQENAAAIIENHSRLKTRQGERALWALLLLPEVGAKAPLPCEGPKRGPIISPEG